MSTPPTKPPSGPTPEEQGSHKMKKGEEELEEKHPKKPFSPQAPMKRINENPEEPNNNKLFQEEESVKKKAPLPTPMDLKKKPTPSETTIQPKEPIPKSNLAASTFLCCSLTLASSFTNLSLTTFK